MYGPNVLLTHFLALLLWLAADVLRPREGMATLGRAILGVIVLNALFAFVQKSKAERALHALRRMLPGHSWVRRSRPSVNLLAHAPLIEFVMRGTHRPLQPVGTV